VTPEPSADVLEREWTRLHPLSPVVQFGRALAVVAFALIPRLASGGSSTSTFIDLGIVVLGLVTGFVHWLVTRWRVVGTELQIETGLIRRQSIRVPVSRIRTVDLVRPALGRVFGLTEVRVEIAGQGSGRGRLAYLPEARATAVRAQLLALSHGLPEQTPAPVGAPVWAVSNARLVASALLGAPTALLTLLLVGIIATAVGAPDALPGVIGTLLPLLIASLSLIARRAAAEYGFSVDVAGDGLRLLSGLVQTRAQTIPAGRVQAVRCTQPLWWRPLGWYRLEVDIARQRSGRRGSEGDSSRVSRALMPVGSSADVEVLLGLVLPHARWQPPSHARPPLRSALKAPLSYAALATWYDDSYVAGRTGRLRRSTVLVPLAKIQSVRWVQGPVQRWLKIATVHVDVAGRGWRAAARCRDQNDSVTVWTELCDRARRARRPCPPQTGLSLEKQHT
jgi:putative membrane protein